MYYIYIYITYHIYIDYVETHCGCGFLKITWFLPLQGTRSPLDVLSHIEKGRPAGDF